MLMSIKPVATQVGQTTEHEVAARYNLYGAFKVLVTGEGVIGEVVPPEKPMESKDGKKPSQEKLKVRFTVAADALPGVRDFRIATPQGVSTIGQLVVGRDRSYPRRGRTIRSRRPRRSTCRPRSAAPSRPTKMSTSTSSRSPPERHSPSTSAVHGWKTRSTTCKRTPIR